MTSSEATSIHRMFMLNVEKFTLVLFTVCQLCFSSTSLVVEMRVLFLTYSYQIGLINIQHELKKVQGVLKCCETT